MPVVASLDALVIKLLEVSQATNPHTTQIKNLASQLPAAAADARARQTGPCFCGLHEEVTRLQEQLQHWIDHHPDTKKGNMHKAHAMENQRLTKAMVEQKEEINRHLTTLRARDNEIQKLQRQLKAARGEVSKCEGGTRSHNVALPAATYPPHESTADGVPSAVPEVVGMESVHTALAHIGKQLAIIQTEIGGNASLFNTATCGNASISFARSVDPPRFETPARAPTVNIPGLFISSVNVARPNGQSDNLSNSEERCKSATFAAAQTSPALSSSKRSAEADFESSSSKRVKTAYSITRRNNSPRLRQPVCEGCRASGAECDHNPRCVECDIQISPCIYVLCDDLDKCQDPCCNYLHDQQWDSQETPVWLIKGVNTFGDGPEHGADDNLTAVEQLQAVKCESSKTEGDFERDEKPVLKHDAGELESVLKEDTAATTQIKTET